MFYSFPLYVSRPLYEHRNIKIVVNLYICIFQYLTGYLSEYKFCLSKLNICIS